MAAKVIVLTVADQNLLKTALNLAIVAAGAGLVPDIFASPLEAAERIKALKERIAP